MYFLALCLRFLNISTPLEWGFGASVSREAMVLHLVLASFTFFSWMLSWRWSSARDKERQAQSSARGWTGRDGERYGCRYSSAHTRRHTVTPCPSFSFQPLLIVSLRPTDTNPCSVFSFPANTVKKVHTSELSSLQRYWSHKELKRDNRGLSPAVTILQQHCV